jgi:hypothetical protein
MIEIEIIIKLQKPCNLNHEKKNCDKVDTSSYSFHGNYSFFNLEIVSNSNSFLNISIFYIINYFFNAETIQGRKLFKGGNYRVSHSKD